MEVFSLPTDQPKKRITIIALIVAAIMTISTVVLLFLYIRKSQDYDYVTAGAHHSRITISDLEDEIDEKNDRIEELEDIIERAQSEVEDLQMHISFDWDNWTLMMDANNIMGVLNEY